jgi:hypothetical protein
MGWTYSSNGKIEEMHADFGGNCVAKRRSRRRLEEGNMKIDVRRLMLRRWEGCGDGSVWCTGASFGVL